MEQILTPKADKAAMLKALTYLHEPGDVVELRAFHKGKKQTDAGYFDAQHWEAMAAHAERLNNPGASIYITLNRIDPQLLSRYHNRIEKYASATATDSHVKRRRWFLVDADPRRPSGTAATDEQVAQAVALADRIRDDLRAAGWPEPAQALSGNGKHLLYPLDMPNDDASRDLIKGALQGLAVTYDNDHVCVDTTVFNAGRITKLYGTVSTKGDHNAQAPWRLSALTDTPPRENMVTPEQLQSLHVSTAPRQDTQTPNYTSNGGGFDLLQFLARLGIPYAMDMHDRRERYKLDHCPFNPDHGKGEAAVFRWPDGKLGFKCQHQTCSKNDWQAVRALVDGPREQRTKSGSGQTHTAPPDQWPDPLPLAGKVYKPEPFPLDALPVPIRQAVQDVYQLTQAPLPMVATSALTALALAAQGHADVARDRMLHGPGSLFALIIGESGERKSTVDRYFTKPIRDYEAEIAVQMEPEIKKHEAELEAWKAERNGITDAIKKHAKEGKPTDSLKRSLDQLELIRPEPPKVPMILHMDTTPEALAWSLARQWPSAGVVSAEAGVVFGSHGMGNDSAMRNLAILNILWDGGEYRSGRRTQESYITRNARLTVSLQVQFQVLLDFMGKQGALARGSGFLARFLICWPESTQGARPYQEPSERLPGLLNFENKIKQLLTQEMQFDLTGHGVEPPKLALTPEAKQTWIAFHDLIESQLAPLGELAEVRDVASKAADNAARLAVLFHVFEHGATGSISDDHMQRACNLEMWYLSESRRLLSELSQAPELSRAAKLDAWLIERCTAQGVNRISTREVLRNVPVSKLRKKNQLDPILDELAELGRIARFDEGRQKWIAVNPALLEGESWD